MYQYKTVEQGCEREFFVAKYNEHKAYECRNDFQKPGKLVFGVDARPEQDCKKDKEPKHFHII